MSTETIDAGAATTQAAPTTAATAAPATTGAPAAGTSAAATDAGTTAGSGTTPAPNVAATEAYAEFKLPEGLTLGDVDADVKGLAKELKLSQDGAQKVVDTAAKLVQSAQAAQAAQVASIHASWKADLATDKEFGGDKLAENLARAKSAMEATATPQLQTLLDKTGLGNHPEVVRHFLKIATAYLPDSSVMPGGKAPGGGKSAAQVLYDSTPS
jgi:hypothetical protein